jgi:hypothetical protein
MEVIMWVFIVILIVALLDLNKRIDDLEQKVKALVDPCRNLLLMWEDVTKNNVEKKEENEIRSLGHQG